MPYINSQSSFEYVRKSPQVPIPIIVVKDIAFFNVTSIFVLFFDAEASEIAGRRVVDNAVRIDEGNIIKGIIIPESSPYKAVAFDEVSPNDCNFCGINIFSIVDKKEPVIRFAVRGIAINKIVEYVDVIDIVDFENKLFVFLKCLCDMYTYTKEAISPRHIPVTAAAAANSTPFGINIPERKYIVDIRTVCSKTWLIAGVKVS